MYMFNDIIPAYLHFPINEDIFSLQYFYFGLSLTVT